MNARSVKWAGLGVGSLLLVLGALSGSKWGASAMVASIGYAILVSIFLLAQIWGFVATQTSYVKEIEDSKFDVLKAEGIECAD